MIKIEKTEVHGWKAAIRGMRNPMNSWEKSDSGTFIDGDEKVFCLGGKDHALMRSLSKLGSDHGKCIRMVTVTCDITAPLYWWKEFDTYKVGTVRCSCSTMHKIHERPLTIDDFSIDTDYVDPDMISFFTEYLDTLNANLQRYRDEGDKTSWECAIKLLPSCYNQKSTVQMNYQVIQSIYSARKGHKLKEWADFISWVESLPYADIITGGE